MNRNKHETNVFGAMLCIGHSCNKERLFVQGLPIYEMNIGPKDKEC